ncbi:phosphatase PAP2 family protein [Lutibacter sp. HS1-25]|uniref:phosphatase PAP2 family protein n=1 Tax=Lutibacter sp. HS1-25 TaxID=2485000 RepID=UPI0010104FC3|nr:phosphatase PAP2 family protein [Lutibacter sp. HS1-25]RXP44590.1 phosphatase PAP2 family protein [Lutibacter sp. HS1-25]
MKIILKFLICIVFFNTIVFNAQTTDIQKDTLELASAVKIKKQRTLLHKSIVPLSLIGVGLAANNSQFEKNLNNDLRDAVGNNFQTSVDDYLLFVPIVQMYAADAFGMKAKNHWFDQTKYLFISNVISTGISELLKSTITKTRPDTSDGNSFPSGHTTIAFTNAAVLQNEFQETSPVYAYSGYAFATTTGVFRMLNNRHYVSDVLVGAGIGILVTQLVYHFEPLKKFNPFKKSKDISFFPQYKENTYGFHFKYEL